MHTQATEKRPCDCGVYTHLCPWCSCMWLPFNTHFIRTENVQEVSASFTVFVHSFIRSIVRSQIHAERTQHCHPYIYTTYNTTKPGMWYLYRYSLAICTTVSSLARSVNRVPLKLGLHGRSTRVIVRIWSGHLVYIQTNYTHDSVTIHVCTRFATSLLLGVG